MDIALGVDAGPHPLEHVGRHRRAGRKHPTHRFQPKPVLLAVAAHAVPDRRRAERLGDLPVFYGLDDLPRVDLRRPRRVHVGDNGCHPHRAVEQAEQREAGQIDLTRPDPVEIADLLHLGVEVSVAVEHTLGGSGAPGGEDDRRRVVCSGGGQLGAPVWLRAEPGQRRSAPKPTPADRQVESGFAKASPKEHSHGVHDGNRHETLRLGLGQAPDQVPSPHARVDQDRHRPRLEQGEHQGDEIDTRPDQQGQPRALLCAQAPQSPGDPVAVMVEFPERDLPIAPLPVRPVPQRLHHRNCIRHGLGRCRQPGRNVNRIGSRGCRRHVGLSSKRCRPFNTSDF